MHKKKIAAAIAAVFAHIKTQEEAAAFHAQAESPFQNPGTGQAVVQQVSGPQNIWGISGRQNQMQANTMMLMRAFK